MTVPQDTPDTPQTRCGFVALVGAPNAGKSTLLNRLIGAKVAIVTHKVQTTRSRVRGIAIQDACQMVFVDTPGIFTPKRRLDRAMVAAAWSAIDDADRVVLIYDATQGGSNRGRIDADTRLILEGLKQRGRQAVLALNKIDAIKREKLLALAQAFEAEGIFARIFMISALNGDGVADLRAYLAEAMPAGPWHYPEDQVSDMPQRQVAAEVTREKLFLRLHQELPYALTVDTEDWEDFKDGSVRIAQVVTVGRESHKGICLGKGGATIKAVREAAQKDLEAMLERKVHLFLHIKVREKWAEDAAHYRAWGLDYEV